MLDLQIVAFFGRFLKSWEAILVAIIYSPVKIIANFVHSKVQEDENLLVPLFKQRTVGSILKSVSMKFNSELCFALQFKQLPTSSVWDWFVIYFGPIC